MMDEAHWEKKPGPGAVRSSSLSLLYFDSKTKSSRRQGSEGKEFSPGRNLQQQVFTLVRSESLPALRVRSLGGVAAGSCPHL